MMGTAGAVKGTELFVLLGVIPTEAECAEEIICIWMAGGGGGGNCMMSSCL